MSWYKKLTPVLSTENVADRDDDEPDLSQNDLPTNSDIGVTDKSRTRFSARRSQFVMTYLQATAMICLSSILISRTASRIVFTFTTPYLTPLLSGKV